MELNALIFMILSWGLTLVLLLFCISKLTKNPKGISTQINKNKLES